MGLLQGFGQFYYYYIIPLICIRSTKETLEYRAYQLLQKREEMISKFLYNHLKWLCQSALEFRSAFKVEEHILNFWISEDSKKK